MTVHDEVLLHLGPVDGEPADGHDRRLLIDRERHRITVVPRATVLQRVHSERAPRLEHDRLDTKVSDIGNRSEAGAVHVAGTCLKKSKILPAHRNGTSVYARADKTRTALGEHEFRAGGTEAVNLPEALEGVKRNESAKGPVDALRDVLVRIRVGRVCQLLLCLPKCHFRMSSRVKLYTAPPTFVKGSGVRH